MHDAMLEKLGLCCEDCEEVDESLWANIHKKRQRIKQGSGEKMRKKGAKGAPTAAQMKRAKGEEVEERKTIKEFNHSFVPIFIFFQGLLSPAPEQAPMVATTDWRHNTVATSDRRHKNSPVLLARAPVPGASAAPTSSCNAR